MYAWVCTAARRRLTAVWWSVHLRSALVWAAASGAAAAAHLGRAGLVERFGERGRYATAAALVGGQAAAAAYYLASYPAIQARAWT